MADNLVLKNNDTDVVGTLALDQVTYSGDVSFVGISRLVHVTGAEGSKTVVELVGQNAAATSLSVVPASDWVLPDTTTGDLAAMVVDLAAIEALLITIDADTSKIPSQGQALSAASLPVVIASNQSAVPISAASLPLPTDAATATKQPALGTAGTASADVITVQGIVSMTPLVVDGSGVTQPVSGTLTVNAGTNLNTSALALESGGNLASAATLLGTIDADTSTLITPIATIGTTPLQRVAIFDASNSQITSFGGGTQYTEGDIDATITGTAMVMEGAGNALVPAQGTVADGLLVNLGGNNDVTVTGSVTANAGTNLNTSALALESGGNLASILTSVQLIDDAVYTDDIPFTAGSNKVMAVGFRFDDTVPDGVSEGDVGYARMSSRREVYTTIRDAAGNERGLNIDASNQISITNVTGTVSLPTGAATAAKQPALGTAGVASADVITVQGIASMTALVVDGSAVTQPVSGTITANAGTNLNTSALALESGGNLATAATLLGTIDADTSTLAAIDFATGADVASLGVTGGGVEATALRVTIASDSTGVLSIDDNNGSITVDLPAVATGGSTPGKLISAATTNATSVKASAGTLYSLCCFNTNAAARYLKLYNKASAPTVGTDTPVQVFTIPGNTAGAGFVVPIPTCGIEFSTGIAFATTTGAADSDTGAVAANEIVVSYSYK